ncbi:MAG: hypothetical protein LBQ66_16460 [Planctomycetaceae bacterium]|nr:hypothetical protein [Planctomycetaceae bacterium]
MSTDFTDFNKKPDYFGFCGGFLSRHLSMRCINALKGQNIIAYGNALVIPHKFAAKRRRTGTRVSRPRSSPRRFAAIIGCRRWGRFGFADTFSAPVVGLRRRNRLAVGCPPYESFTL